MARRLQVVTESDAWLPLHAEQLDSPVQQRAFELYCGRDKAQGCAADDWDRARHEVELFPMAGIAESEKEIRVSARVAHCVRGRDSVLTLHVLPHYIVGEEDRWNSIVRLPAAVRNDAVSASLHGDQLTIIAEKAT